MARKFYLNRKWLHRQYVKEGKTAKQIAVQCNTTEMTITRWLKKHGLKRDIKSYRRS